MKMFSTKPSKTKREVVTKTEIKEVEKEVIIYKEPQFSTLRPAFPAITTDQKEEVKISVLKNIDKNILTGFLTLTDDISSVRKYIETQANLDQVRFNKIFATSQDYEKIVNKLKESINKEIKEFLNTGNVRDTRIIQTLNQIKNEVDRIKSDRVDNLNEIISPHIEALLKKIEPINELTELKTETQASLYVFKEFEKTLLSYKASFDFLEEHLEKITNFQKESIDPEIKFYYLQFTEKLGDFKHTLDAFKELSYKMDFIQKDYEAKINSKIESMEDRYNKAISTFEQIVENLKSNLKKETPQQLIINQTYVNETSFIDIYDDLPDPKEHKGKELFVKRNTFKNWKLKLKGIYVSDGNSWFKK